MEMDINELVVNMQAYEAEVSLSEMGGQVSHEQPNLTISIIQTLTTLY